jgi:hypothetical protein
MNRTVFKLLQGYFFRSGWLYAFVGLVQFLLTSFYWAERYDRAPAAGVVLGIWGAAAALNRQSLVWRSLPLNLRDASVFRWWATAGVPGIYLTLVTYIAWDWQRSRGFPTPDSAAIWEGILATWALLGVVAALSRKAQWPARFRAVKIIAAVGGSALLLAYPVGPAARPYSIVSIGLGIILLLVTAARARGGMDWRWPDLADRAQRSSKHATFRFTPRYGLSAILIPLARRTALFAIVATLIIVSLQRIFPRGAMALFWVYFIGLSTGGFLLTYQVRRAIQPLRCLPLSAKQLAGLLLLYGALPGLVTLGLTLLINRAVLNAELDAWQVATFAMVIIASQALPLNPAMTTGRSVRFAYWITLIQRLFLPAYLGLMAVSWGQAYSRFTWMRWPLQAAGVGLCIAGYFILVAQLRSGIRPSSNETAFSPG